MAWSDTKMRPTTLIGQHAALVPLDGDFHDDLIAAASDGELWSLWYTWVPKPEDMRSEIQRRLRLQGEGSMRPFVVVDMRKDVPTHGKAVGMTSFMNIDGVNRRVEIGGTWYAKSVQRSVLNTECKLMLLNHAFETLDCIAVELRTHSFNEPGRAAIERIGAKLDGILRNHQINTHPDALGSLRDTCVYSITQSEWPAVEAHLTAWVARES
jgi:RimJ/RimL family protein N-acetyltransferase